MVTCTNSISSDDRPDVRYNASVNQVFIDLDGDYGMQSKEGTAHDSQVDYYDDAPFFYDIVNDISLLLIGENYDYLLNNKDSFIAYLQEMYGNIQLEEDKEEKIKKIDVVKQIFIEIKNQSTGNNINLPGAVLAKHRGIGRAFSFFTGPTCNAPH